MTVKPFLYPCRRAVRELIQLRHYLIYTHVSQAPFLGGQVVIQIGVLTHIKMMACS